MTFQILYTNIKAQNAILKKYCVLEITRNSRLKLVQEALEIHYSFPYILPDSDLYNIHRPIIRFGSFVQSKTSYDTGQKPFSFKENTRKTRKKITPVEIHTQQNRS